MRWGMPNLGKGTNGVLHRRVEEGALPPALARRPRSIFSKMKP